MRIHWGISNISGESRNIVVVEITSTLAVSTHVYIKEQQMQTFQTFFLNLLSLDRDFHMFFVAFENSHGALLWTKNSI